MAWYKLKIAVLKPINILHNQYEVCSLFGKVSARHAGHSKWHNIRHIKAAKDMQKCQAYQRHMYQMRIAVIRNGGITDPHLNSSLKDIITSARKINMPNSTIESALKRLKEDKGNATILIHEIRGPDNIGLLVLTLTSKKGQIIGDIRSCVRKFKKFNMANKDSIKHLFNRRGVVIAEPIEAIDSQDKAIEHAIEVEAEEVEPLEENPNHFQFFCDADDLNKVSTKLKARNYNIISSEELYIPYNYVEVAEENTSELEELYDKLESIPEVLKIFDNLK